MEKIFKLSLLLIILLGLFSCNKDDYGKEFDELIKDVEFTKEEMLTGFANYGKTWFSESIEFDGVVYIPDLTGNINEGYAKIPVLKTKYFDGTDSVEVDSIYHRFKLASIGFYQDNISDVYVDKIDISINMVTMQLQDFYHAGLSYEIVDAFANLDGKYVYNEANDGITVIEPTPRFSGMDFDRDDFFRGREDTTYADFNVEILELTENKLKIKWVDPTMDLEYIINMTDDSPYDQN